MLDEIEHPEIKLLNGEAREEYREEKKTESVNCRGCINEEGIYLNLNREKLALKTYVHEYLHHILDAVEGEEVTHQLDNEGFGHWLGHLLYPRRCLCLYCKHYTPASMGISEGWCTKEEGRENIKKVNSSWICKDSRIDPIIEHLPISDYDVWRRYRQNERSLSALYELAESDSERVRERYLKRLKERADFYRDHSDDQFRLDCKNLGGECDPDYCMEDCSEFEKGTPKIFKYLEEAR